MFRKDLAIKLILGNNSPTLIIGNMLAGIAALFILRYNLGLIPAAKGFMICQFPHRHPPFAI